MMQRITPGDRRRVKDSAFEGMKAQDIIPSLEQFRGSREAMERYCLDLQRKQQSFIDMNHRLMESGKIDFDEYKEL